MGSPRKVASAGALLLSALDEIDHALRGARRSVAIAAPFLSLPVADRLIRAADAGKAAQRRLITAVNDAAVAGGYLDPYAVERFVEAGFEVRSLRNLHAKVVVVDGTWGIVGSGNLTAAGLDGGNAELGVVLGAKQAVAARDRHFASWWRAAEPVDMARLRRIAAQRRPRSPRDRQRAGQGGIWKPPIKKAPRLPRRRGSGGYWLKIMYDLPGRRPASHWRDGAWISDRHTLAPDGRALRRPSYEIGDHLVVYLAGGEQPRCPAVLQVTAEPVFDPRRVRREGRAGDDERWAWLTEVDLVTAAKTIDDAPTLTDIGVSHESVRQQGRIRLTPDQYRRAFDALKP
ncbi:MAG: phospholipase D-like domain-containing protein [Actinomycetota bacterium]|nr:phospholipase D-like domain-containing protein [Actinomycetota bacterium]